MKTNSYISTSITAYQKVRLTIIIERGLKRAMVWQSKKHGCAVRPDSGSMSEIANRYIREGLKRDGVNVNEIIKSGL